MNRFLTVLVFIILSNTLVAQNKFDDIVPHKRSFSSEANYKNSLREKVIISNDYIV